MQFVGFLELIGVMNFSTKLYWMTRSKWNNRIFTISYTGVSSEYAVSDSSTADDFSDAGMVSSSIPDVVSQIGVQRPQRKLSSIDWMCCHYLIQWLDY